MGCEQDHVGGYERARAEHGALELAGTGVLEGYQQRSHRGIVGVGGLSSADDGVVAFDDARLECDRVLAAPVPEGQQN